MAGVGRVQIDLSDGQLLKLAEILHLQETEKIHELRFSSYADQQKYLNDSKAAWENVKCLMSSVETMNERARSEEDATKKSIAAEVYGYCTYSIRMSLQLIRSYSTRLTFLTKLKTHCDSLIRQLHALDPVTQMREAQRLAIEAGMYKKATLNYAEKFQHPILNQFTKWLKEKGVKFEDLVKRFQGRQVKQKADKSSSYMSKLGFNGAFKNLADIQKLQVYEGIIEAAGRGKSVVTYTFQALGGVGVALLVFTAGIMVWDIYTAQNKVEAAVRDSVKALIPVVSLVIGDVATTAIRAGFEALDIAIASAAITVMGVVTGIGAGIIIGMAAGALLDLIFDSGTPNVDAADGLTSCRVAPMPDGFEVARRVKYLYPDL